MAVIYGIVRTSTQHAYIGITACKPAKRFREHRCLLRNGKHTSWRLQADWNQYGPDEFEFVILEDIGHNVTLERKRSAEQKWIDARDGAGLLYNTYKCAFGMPRDVTLKGVEAARHVTGNRWSEEANERRRLSQLGKPKGHGDKISRTKQAKRLAKSLTS